MAGDVPFRELLQYAIGGGWGDETPSQDTVPVRVIRGTDFQNISSGAFDQVPRRFESSRKVKHRVLRPNDIVIEISGGSPTSNRSTGRTLFITKEILKHLGGKVIPASFCRLVRLKRDVDSRFGYYVLREMHLSGRAGIYEHRSTGISNFQFEYFLDQELVKLPSLPQQRAIAHILGTLDDKIELNRRMNETLEAMARTIFKDWFVDFGPTCAKMEGHAPYLPAEIWDLFPDALDAEGKPVGWKQGSLADIADSPRRGVNPTDVAEDTPYIGLKHIPRRSIAISEWEGAEAVTSTKSVFKKGEFLFGKLAPHFHKVGLAPLDGICSTDIIVVVPRSPEWGAFVLTCISSDVLVDYTGRTSTGTTMPRTSWKTMGRYRLHLPSEQIARVFQDLVGLPLSRIDANIHENRALAQLRDTLLPRLLGGKIELPETMTEEVS